MHWFLFARSTWAQLATVVAGATGEGAAMDSDLMVCVVSASHCGGMHDSRGRCTDLCSLGRRVLSQPLCCRERLVRALL
jgi:hypothetical protein